MRSLRRVSALALAALLAFGFAASCKPRVRVRPRMPKLGAKRGGADALAKRRALTRKRNTLEARKRPSVLRRFTDFQVDELIEGLVHEAAGVEDIQERYQRLTREKQLAVLSRVRAQPQRRDARFALLRRALR